MILRLVALVLALDAGLLANASPALAADARLRSVFYQPADIVMVPGRVGYQSTILFAPDERVENIAVGDSSAWQVTPNKRANLIFLKPVVARARTNMTVVTDRRTYMFDLTATPGAPLLYALRFTYPAEPAPPPAPEAEPDPMMVADARPPSLDLNFDWQAKGSKRLLPMRSFDDGKSVYLAWSAGIALPAILTVAADGTEGAVNFTSQSEYLVIDGVPQQLVLRSGREMATLTTKRVRTAHVQPSEPIADAKLAAAAISGRH